MADGNANASDHSFIAELKRVRDDHST